jgi:hypothetical protein
MYFRPLALMLVLFFCSSSETQAQDVVLKGVQMNAPHPRLLLTKADEAAVRASVKKDAFWQQVDSLLMNAANDALTMPMPQRIVIGRRLLDVSRETLRRVLLLGYAYRMTGDSRYAQRAEQELLSVSAFSDWNPSHFILVANTHICRVSGKKGNKWRIYSQTFGGQSSKRHRGRRATHLCRLLLCRGVSSIQKDGIRYA